MGLVTAVAAAGGVFLILAIALAVAVVQVKKRFKGALADRNRVYAMEQFNKYVKDEKDNDGFAQDDDVNGSGEQNFNMKACTWKASSQLTGLEEDNVVWRIAFYSRSSAVECALFCF